VLIFRLLSITCVSVVAIRAIGTRAHAMHSTAYFSLSCVIIVSMIGLFLSGALSYAQRNGSGVCHCYR
ncbi:hypothetical protein EDC04DRAFT_2734846, partial [Pisolithus marmoratus]